MRTLGLRSGLTILMAAVLWIPVPSHALEVPKGVIRLQPHPAPALKLSDMDGNGTDIKALRGKWLFVHFWASWCGPCRRELPLLQTLSDTIHSKRFQMVLVNTAEDEDTVFAFLAAVAPDLHTLMDRDGEVTEAWQPRGLPATYLVDPQGQLRYLALGGRAWNRPGYVGFIRALLAGM